MSNVRRSLVSLLTTSLLVLGACSSRGSEGSDSRVTTERSEFSVAGGIVKTTREKTTTEPAEPIPVPEDERPQPHAQAGLLTAGDTDDLINADQYAKYAGRFLQAAGGRLPFVDARTRVAVRVVDSAGRPVPFAKVEIARSRGPLRLVAAADGTASFYPRFDEVPEKTSLRVTSSSGSGGRTIDLAANPSHRLDVSVGGSSHPVTAMDVAFVIDTTGSMGDEMAYLQAELDSIIDRLKRDAGNLDLRIGVVLYRDEGDDYVVRSTPLTGDVGSIRSMLAAQDAEGGGDTPEAVDQAIIAAGKLQWRPDAAKALLLVADAPPHDDRLAVTMDATKELRSRGVQIVPVAASGVEANAEYMMRTMAALTQGRYIFLTDDSSVGNPHQEPDVSCYVVTHLDQLIGRVLAGIAQGRRIEPSQGEVIRMVGSYDRGRCLAARGDSQT